MPESKNNGLLPTGLVRRTKSGHNRWRYLSVWSRCVSGCRTHTCTKQCPLHHGAVPVFLSAHDAGVAGVAATFALSFESKPGRSHRRSLSSCDSDSSPFSPFESDQPGFGAALLFPLHRTLECISSGRLQM